mgnify:FL=1
MSKILIIEDTAGIAELERDYFEANGYEVELKEDGKAGLEAALANDYSLIICDIMLPSMDGFQIVREIRTVKETPILMVTAKTEEIDKIRGLGLGVDDYIVKPFSPNELVARAKAHIARYERLTNQSQQEEKQVIVCDELEIQLDRRRVMVNGTEVVLANREFELLAFMAQNPGIVFSKDRLLERVWGFEALGDTATVTVHVNRIREKIEPDPNNPKFIETVWGVGYRFHES